MTALPPSTAPVPHGQSKVRIQALDVIRGVAVLGILAVNADGFAVPIFSSLKPETWPFPNEGWTALSYWFMDAFFHEKFVTTFSMLFGVSIFLVGGEWADKTRGYILCRRLAVLLIFGLIHGFLIWWGDILSLYAITGMFMLFCRSWSSRLLLIVGVALYLAMVVRTIDPAVLPFASTEARATAVAHLTPSGEALAGMRAHASQVLAQAKSSWEAALQVNVQSYLMLLSGIPWLLPSTLGLMMLGLGLFKTGFMAGRSSARVYSAVAGVGAVALAVTAWVSWREVMIEVPVLGGHAIKALAAVPVALGYISVLMLLLKAGAGSVLAPVAATGRMAFTNYLTQSLIMTTIFSAGRGGLMGEVDRPALWGIVIAVWALQLLWSPLWLSKFEMGPFEWVWRCLTLGRRLPIRKGANS